MKFNPFVPLLIIGEVSLGRFLKGFVHPGRNAEADRRWRPCRIFERASHGRTPEHLGVS